MTTRRCLRRHGHTTGCLSLDLFHEFYVRAFSIASARAAQPLQQAASDIWPADLPTSPSPKKLKAHYQRLPKKEERRLKALRRLLQADSFKEKGHYDAEITA